MKTQRFDAVLPSNLREKVGPHALLTHAARRCRADVRFYLSPALNGCSIEFLQLLPNRPVDTRWGEEWDLWDPDGTTLWGRLRVVDPDAPKLSRRPSRRRLEILAALSRGEKEMMLALTESKGVHGLTENEIERFASLPPKSGLRWAQELEAEGRIKILSFSPLFLLAESSYIHLCDRILTHIETQHRAKPDLIGISVPMLRARFRVPERILWLALKRLEREDRIQRRGDRILPPDLRIAVSPEEERLLTELEELSLKGELKRLSLEEIRKRFRLSGAKWDRLLVLLIERKKVVQGLDGFLIHSQWLDAIISRLRSLGRREITIAEFKSLTNLSRKYAIPLLELLDQLGITRRSGSKREIL